MSAATPLGIGAYVRIGKGLIGRIVDKTTRNDETWWIVKTPKQIVQARSASLTVRD